MVERVGGGALRCAVIGATALKVKDTTMEESTRLEEGVSFRGGFITL